MICKYKGNTPDLNFYEFDNALALINKIRDGKINLTDVKNNQETFKSYLGKTKRGNNKRRSKEQKNALYNIKTLHKARNKFIKFHDDCFLILSKAKIKATKGTELKILTHKQMLQRLPITLAQVKAGNNSENLLSEIRKIVYSLYQSKQFTKKVFNNIIKSIQL